MLEAVTKKFTDESADGVYRFTFYCDICGKTWESIPYSSINNVLSVYERNSAFERANREASLQFNRCPVCRLIVCDDCFRILEDKDICFKCLEEAGE